MGGFKFASWLVADGFRALYGPTANGIAGYFLAGVFAWSGFAKLRRPALAAMAIVDFGVSRRVRPILGTMLGASEVGLATLLAARLVPRVFLIVAAVLLWAFAILIARSLWSGERFACFCFGNADSELSPVALSRTVLLALLASGLAAAATLRDDLSTASLLEALAGVSLLGTLALIGHVRQLIVGDRSNPHGDLRPSQTAAKPI